MTISTFELSSLLAANGGDGSAGFVINGIDADNTGNSSFNTVGDINGDGIDDILIGAYGADPNGTDSGESFVVFGQDDSVTPFAAILELSALNGANGFVLNGIDAGDESGWSVSAAGDINGDGIDDILIGAYGGDLNGANSGESYVVFGQDDSVTPFAASLELSALDGTNGFVINGIDAGDGSGRRVSAAGDVNNDGLDDILIGAPLAAPNGNFSGESYVLFGQDDSVTPFAASLELSALNGSNGFVINGIDAFDYSGASVSAAGDINGDGIDDILIGASFADPNGSTSGESYVVFGQDDGVTPFAASLELSALNGTNGFVINGINAFDISGVSVSAAGDINGDGFDDILIGASGGDPNGSSTGESYVVFGRDASITPFAASLELSALDGTNGFVLNGIDSGVASGFSVSAAGDLNSDGIDDILIGSSGERYVVFGSTGFGPQIAGPTPGNDNLTGTPGVDVIDLLAGNDIYDGLGGDDTIDGAGGNDTLFGGAGDDILIGGDGADALDGGPGNDTADYTGSGNQVIINMATGSITSGQASGDTFTDIENVTGSGFGDIITGDSGANVLSGGAGNDILSGFTGNDTILGGTSDDFITGGAGADIIDGGAGNNWLFGSAGDDTLTGGAGFDKLFGGTGADTFVFNAGDVATWVTDFENDIDTIDLSSYGTYATANDALMDMSPLGSAVRYFNGGDTMIILNTTMADIADDIVV